MTRRIGILGGTFDPPHLGHLVVAECARVELGLDEVRLLVAGDPWMKPVTTPAAVRVELATLAVADAPGIVVDDRETRREGPTYTIDTIDELDREEPGTQWLFLIGNDLVAQLDQWHRAAELATRVDFVVVTRHVGEPPSNNATVLGPDGRVLQRLAVPTIDVSSTTLRARYRDRRATRHLVPAAVDDAIRDQQLYGGDDGG